jgi:hypothetical protein
MGGAGSSLSQRARDRRHRRLLESFPDLADMSVVDLGGTVDYWIRSGLRPARVVVVNLSDGALDRSDPSSEWITTRRGDACNFDGGGEAFDLAFSNSVIEHVGGFVRRQQFADRIHELAPRHWVQTPDRYFPLEPHWGFPGMQFLPVRARLWVASRWAWGPRGADERSVERTRANEDECLMTDLIASAELQRLFPASVVWSERVLGLSKSLVAIGGGAGDGTVASLRPAS